MPTLQAAVEDLFELVDRTDPTRAKAPIAEALLTRARGLAEQLRELSLETSDHGHYGAPGALRDLLRSSSENLSRFAQAIEKSDVLREWREHHATIAKDYAALTKALERLGADRTPHFRRLTPINYTRNAFHITGGVVAAVMYHAVLSWTGAFLVMFTFAGTFTTLEILRWRSRELNERLMRFAFFRKIARPHEHVRVNSSTFFAWGLLISVIIGSREAVEAACLVCAFGDPAASILGKRYGRRKLFRDRSVLGTGVFIGVSTAIVFVFQLVAHPALSIPTAFAVSLIAGVAGAAAELLSTRLDDNFTVPVSVTLALTLLA
jgi:dolichol kinase